MIEILSYSEDLPPIDHDIVRSAAEHALAHENRNGDVTVLLTNDEEIRSMNSHFRNIDRVTDVLTFPAWEGDALLTPPDGYLGDIAICIPRAIEQAEQYGHSLDREIAFLAVHGCLHLLGYDHINSEDEKTMRSKQTEILNEMGLSVGMFSAEERSEMLKRAYEAMKYAYTPYSHFNVGACLKTAAGKYYSGCNIENAAYGPSNCAERTAVFKAVSEGEHDFSALAVVCSGDYPAVPCGICRQVLCEFCDPDFRVVCANKDGHYEEYRLSDLLPHSFGKKDLDR